MSRKADWMLVTGDWILDALRGEGCGLRVTSYEVRVAWYGARGTRHGAKSRGHIIKMVSGVRFQVSVG